MDREDFESLLDPNPLRVCMADCLRDVHEPYFDVI